MRPSKPRVARLEEVEITRDKDVAIIRFRDEEVATTHLKIGSDLQRMSDDEILAQYNEVVRAQQMLAASYHHVAIEVPPGDPQIKYSSRSGQWIPRGDVLRCLVEDGGPDNQAIICIDDEELSLEEFGRLLTTYAGWGMRICFVPDDEIEKQPEIEVREPDSDEEP